MASAARMMFIGIVWIVSMFILGVLAMVGTLVLSYCTSLVMTFGIVPQLAQALGNAWWILGFYEVLILGFAIVITYRCYQEVIVVSDYFPDTGVM